MAIAYDNAVVNLSISSGTNSTTITVSSSVNRVMFAGIFSTGGDDLNNVTATKGGSQVAMTFIGKIINNGLEEVYLYYIVNPDSGTNTVTATLSGTPTTRMSVATYIGASQTGVPDASATGQSTNGGTGTLTTIANNCWAVMFVRGSTDVVASTNSTERPSAAGSTSAIFDSNGPITPAGSFSMLYTDTGPSAWVMASFSPAGGGVSTPSFRRLLGVGN